MRAWLCLVVGCGSGDAAQSPTSHRPVDASTLFSDLTEVVGTIVPDAGIEKDAEPTREGPPFPIVLAHGFGGFDELGPLSYFFGVAEALAADGHQVFVSEVTAADTSIVRGAELLAFVDSVRAKTGTARVNLIGHSQGGLDARVVAHDAPDWIASVVTIATPHRGTSIADAVLDRSPGAAALLGEAVFRIYGRRFTGNPDDDPDVRAALRQLSVTESTAFNAEYTDAAGVAYFSATGRTALRRGGEACLFPGRPDFVTRWDDERDTREPLLWITGVFLDPEGVNDGLVTVASAAWGTFLGCLPADHYDEVGQIAGDAPGLGNEFDYLAFYRALADFLVVQGF